MRNLNKSILLLLCVFYCAFTSVVQGKIVETTTMQDVSKSIQGPTWVLFDVDDTIMDSAHHLSSGPWISFYWKKVPTLFPNKTEIIEKLMWHVTQKVPVKPIEEITPCLISHLQNRKDVVVLGLTARSQVSMVGENGAPEDLTVRQLRSIGVNFSQTKYPRNLVKHASFHQGIIFTSGKLKGPTLREILAHAKVKPRRVIFIDDLHKQASSVDQAMKAEGITCICFVYKRGELVRPAFDPHIGTIQLKYLLMHEKLLSDTEADSLKLNHPKEHMDHLLREVVEHFEAKG